MRNYLPGSNWIFNPILKAKYEEIKLLLEGENEMKKEFTNDDLKAGMYVELKNGVEGILIPCKSCIAPNGEKLIVVSSFGYDGRECVARLYVEGKTHYGIVKVYDLNEGNGCDFCSSINRELLWKYEEPKKEMTVEQIEKELGYKIKIVGEKNE